MLTSYVSQLTGVRHITNWINGGHPSIADGQVRRTVCFHWNAGCCEFSTIKERNCGLTYCVYNLNRISPCYGRYCGTD